MFVGKYACDGRSWDEMCAGRNAGKKSEMRRNSKATESDKQTSKHMALALHYSACMERFGVVCRDMICQARSGLRYHLHK